MLISLNWLKQYIDLEGIDIKEMEEALTMIGQEVEKIEIAGGNLNNVVIVKILKKEKHPNADTLSLCKVDNGKEILQIVCGAIVTGKQKNLVAMGIAVTDATGKLRSQTDVMLDLAGVIEKTNDPLRRLEIAQAALGKSGGQFIEALKDGPAALRELMTEADALGQVFSKEDAIAADQFNDNLDKLKLIS